MRRTLRMACVAGALASGVVPGLIVPSTHAQAPARAASGSQSYASTRSTVTPSPPSNTALPSQASAAAPAGGYYYPPRASAAAPAGGYYYPSQAPTAAPAGGYYYPSRAAAAPSPAPANAGRNYYYYSTPAAPARGRTGPQNIRRAPPQSRPGDDDDYAYKS